VAPGPADAVVLVSIDGLRWDDPAKAGAVHLERLARRGAMAEILLPPFPSTTFPAHASLATGVYPDRHGILNNEFLDRRRGAYRMADDAGWLLAEPLWVTAERQGRPAAIYHWVCSYAPWQGTAASIREPFDPRVADSDKIDRLIDWLHRTDAGRPRLLMAYLKGPDAAGHRDGPGTPAVLERVRQADRLIGRLMLAVEGAGRRAALVVVSDHGMAPVSRVHRLDRLLRGKAGSVRHFSSGATSNLYCPDAAACDAAADALAAIAGVEVLRLEGLPADLRYRLPSRTGDLVAIAPRGSYFADGDSGRPEARGMHGYRPEVREMGGIARAWGAGVRAGARVETLRAVDIAPLVCRLLGIEPPPGIDGQVPEAFLEPGLRKGAPRAHPPEASRPGDGAPP
jgi:predicted AlkP superfamily pyrophosphatase or phosphodiesterase